MTDITAAGFIVADNEAIWGAGKTADAAWTDFLGTMKIGNVTIIPEGESVPDDIYNLGEWARAEDFRIFPATATLLAQIEENGGNVSWARIDGICCAREEEV